VIGADGMHQGNKSRGADLGKLFRSEFRHYIHDLLINLIVNVDVVDNGVPAMAIH
jgi:predicted heme/steroid binding protein